MADDEAFRRHEDRETRVVAKVRVDVVVVPPDADGVESGGLLPPPGSIVVYTGRVDSPAWPALRRSALSGDWRRLRDTPVPRAPRHLHRAERSVPQGMFFDVRCAGRTLMRDAALHEDMEFGTLLFPYTGGTVEDADFEIVEYRRPGAAPGEFSYLALRRPPELTPLERQLLDKVDADLREIHIGPHLPCGDVTAMDAVADVRDLEDGREPRVRARGAGELADEHSMKLSDDIVEEIAGRDGGPAASVVELLALRRRLLKS